MRNILIAGVPNSPNIGDRLIAKSLNHLINSLGKFNITNIDITTGETFREYTPNQSISKINRRKKLKRIIPNKLRAIKNLYKGTISDGTILGKISDHIKNADVILVGGGNLLIDNYLNFPIAIHRLYKLAKKYDKNLYIVCVGARGPWSLIAKKYFLEIMHYAKEIVVRDSESKKFLLKNEPSFKNKINVSIDPAFFTKELYKEYHNQNNCNDHSIGLGIMDPNEMTKHTSVKWSREECANWWLNIAEYFSSKGYMINIFTNGAPTDNEYVETFIKNRLTGNNVSYMKYPLTVDELITPILQSNIIIAQRLHACIPAISLDKLTFGVKWDVKLENIFKDLEMGNFVLTQSDEKSTIVSQVEKKLGKKSINNTKLKLEEKKDKLVKVMANILSL